MVVDLTEVNQRQTGTGVGEEVPSERGVGPIAQPMNDSNVPCPVDLLAGDHGSSVSHYGALATAHTLNHPGTALARQCRRFR